MIKLHHIYYSLSSNNSIVLFITVWEKLKSTKATERWQSLVEVYSNYMCTGHWMVLLYDSSLKLIRPNYYSCPIGSFIWYYYSYTQYCLNQHESKRACTPCTLMLIKKLKLVWCQHSHAL